MRHVEIKSVGGELMSERTLAEVPEVPEIPEVPKKKRMRVRTLAAIVLIIIVGFAAVSVFRWWFTERVPATGYKTYSKYDISFDYPAGADTVEQGLFKNKPDVDSGLVECDWSEGAIEYSFMVCWVKTIQFDIEGGFEGGFSSLEETEGVSNVVRGAQGESTLAGYTLYYQYMEYDVYAKHFYGVVALTYFGELEKGFVFAYACEYENPLPRLEEILETFEAK